MLTLLVAAQTGGIRGKIVDAETNEPLIGSTIAVLKTSKGGIADLEGNFRINNIPVGKQTIEISFVGYDKYTLEVEVLSDQLIEIEEIKLGSNAIGLKEVEVFASVVEDRKTPVAVSAIGAQALDERHSGVALAEVVRNTPGVYAIQGAGGYGDNEVYIRGFDQSNVAFLVNGIPVNDMENGRMFWSNFAGLNEVTRQLQVQRGLGASKLAISSIGGTVNMITKPSERREGGRIEYQTGTGSWNNRMRMTLHTGQLDGGWAVSFQGSRTTTNSILVGMESEGQGSVLPGAFTDAWSYYLAVSKEINDNHQIMFWGFGAPVNRGSAWAPSDSTRNVFDLEGPRQNDALGIYRGEIHNVRQNKVNKPIMAISHYWDVNEKSSWNTSLYYSYAKVYSVQPRDDENSTFIPIRSTEGLSAWDIEDPDRAVLPGNIINWDYFAELNRAADRLMTIPNPGGNPDVSSITGYNSRFYSEARYNNHNWIGLISNYETTLEDNIDLTAGIDLRHYKGSHYAEVHNLYGGDFIVNQSSFDDEMNKLAPMTAAKEGDRINYDYDGYVDWAAGFVQGEYSLDKFNFFLTGTLTQTWYTRVGNFWNGRDIYEYNSFGKSETKSFTTYTVKAGANYRPTNRHNVYINGGYFTRPPFFRNSFADARYSNEFRSELTTEKVYTGEFGYSFRMSKARINLNGYYLIWQDRTTTDEFNEQTENGSEFIPFTINGLESRHMGVELDFTYNIFASLEIGGYLSLGDWAWNNSPTQTIQYTNTNGESEVFTSTFDLKGLPVGTAAQTTAGLNLHYTGIRNMYIGSRWNYADRIPIRYAPEDIGSSNNYIGREVVENGFPAYHDVSIYAGRYINFTDGLRGRLSVSVQNLLDAEYTRWASYFFGQTSRVMGYPRTYTIGLSVDF